MKRFCWVAMFSLAAGLAAGGAAAQDACGELKNFYGPFDYRTAVR